MASAWLVLFLLWGIFNIADGARNIALRKPAMSSSVLYRQPGINAVDGNLNSIIHTRDYETYAWWRVDLQTLVTDADITIYFRIIYPYRRPGLQFYVSKSPFADPTSSQWVPPDEVRHIYTTIGTYQTISDIYTFNTTGQYRYLVVYTVTEYHLYGVVLDFREIQVWACDEGFYDPDCAKNCSSRGCEGSSSCPYNTGVCQNGCKARYTGIDCYGCSKGLYGEDCDQNCKLRNCDDPGATCTRFNYTCLCQEGWTGDHCRTECLETHYGKNCVKSCASRQCVVLSSTCDRFKGECPRGCQAGYKLPDCSERCDTDHYGENCSLKCEARNCKRLVMSGCTADTGRCSFGCEDGWQGEDCRTECDIGEYGTGCLRLCKSRSCLTPSDTCDHVTGACSDDGCKAGWRGVDCSEECPPDLYGRNCSNQCIERKCKTPRSRCNRTTGECPDGCQDGWFGIDCTSLCPDGWYLPNCTKSCDDRSCKDKTSACPFRDGRCDTGCSDGFISVDCTTPCSDGTFGEDCTRGCGNCRGNCHNVNGFCLEGCMDGFIGDLCVQPFVSVSPVGAIIGGILAVLAVIAIIVVIALVKRKKGKPTYTKPQTVGDTKDDNVYVNVSTADLTDATAQKTTPNSGEYIIRNTTDKLQGTYETIEIQSKPKSAVKPTKQKNFEDAEVKPKPTAAVKPIKQKSVEDNDTDEEVLEEESRPTDVYYNQTEEDPIREVSVPELAATVTKVQGRENGFLTEYLRLPTGFTASYDDSQKAENNGKNKFKGYYPYDHNRVKLQLLPGVPGSDYINASFIQNYNKTKTFIAAQAANKKTVGDFWRMIWEHKCNRVIMLTGLIEQRKVKCEKYWPDGETKHIDDLEIKTECTDTRADYTIRHIQVRSKSTKEQRTVVHYHYTTWPDHGVPNTLSLVKFIWNIRRTDSDTDGPLLVHCSAGIGRTGTYIAVDSLYDQARDEGKVDVPAYVAEMRSQRKNMIQTHEQYECVFLCLVEMTAYGDTSLSSSDFVNTYRSRGMDTEVDGRSLKQLTEKVLAQPCNDTDSHRMWVDGNEEFVITHSPSFSHPKGFLLTVTPSPALNKLFWKLVEENEVHSILAVSPLQDELTGGKGEKTQYGNIAIETRKINALSSELSVVTLQLTETVQEPEVIRTVRLYKLDGAVGMDTLSTLLTTCPELLNTWAESPQTVVLHSNPDKHNAVLFCIMCNILGETISEGRVDVISHVRKYNQHFPDVKRTQLDVKTLHDFTCQHLQMTDYSNTYANL